MGQHWILIKLLRNGKKVIILTNYWEAAASWWLWAEFWICFKYKIKMMPRGESPRGSRESEIGIPFLTFPSNHWSRITNWKKKNAKYRKITKKMRPKRLFRQKIFCVLFSVFVSFFFNFRKLFDKIRFSYVNYVKKTLKDIRNMPNHLEKL